ncbi:hypothetical protein [Agrococcus jejuensis]|uniref:hypothetical protein n=1 Tax=Agrococcus jejuensis TaxID=399736 RepID=UPI0011A33365|nr:hypothetical protein [Agrococcus jejuensis]
MQSLTAANLATARALGVRAGLRGDPDPALTADTLWDLVMPFDARDAERSARRRLHAAFRRGALARRLELESAQSAAA